MYKRYLSFTMLTCVCLTVFATKTIADDIMTSVSSVLINNLPVFQTPKLSVNKKEDKAEFMPGRIIIKLKDTAVSPVMTSSVSGVKVSSASTLSNASSLRKLNSKYKVKALKPLFRSEADDKALIRQNGFVSAAGMKVQAQSMVNKIKSKYPKRTRRVSAALSGAATIPQNVYVLEIDKKMDVKQVVAEYSKDPNVAYAQPDYVMKVNMAVNDPMYPQLWGTQKIKADKVWDRAQGEGVLVAVVDTGLDYNHPDISDNVWVNTQEIANNGIDDDGNGFIDDVRGWNFTAGTNDSMDGNGHGTHVAGTIAAVGNNNLGIIGVAPRAKIMSVKGLSDEGNGSIEGLANAIIYAARNGADVINNSWGCVGVCPSNPVVEDAVRTAVGLGTIVVFAAGNSNMDVAGMSPQNMKEVITVAASDSDDHRAVFSNWGGHIDNAAPGVDIISLNSRGGDNKIAHARPELVVDGNLRLSGTSMAAPHMVGAVALLLSSGRTFLNEEIQSLLHSSADDIEQAGFDINSGYGRINLEKAFDGRSVFVPSITSPLVNTSVGKVVLTVRGSIQGNREDFDYYKLSYKNAQNSDSQWIDVTSNVFIFPANGVLGNWDIRSLLYGQYLLKLTVMSKQGNVFEDFTSLLVDNDVLPGWPQKLETDNTIYFSPVVVDLDNDGQNEVFSISRRGYAYLWDAQGRILPGWPQQIPLERPTGQGEEELYMIALMDPAVADMDGDGQKEIIIADTLHHKESIHIIRKDGTELPGWPKRLGSQAPGNVQVYLTTGVAIGDIDRDGKNDIVYSYQRDRFIDGNWFLDNEVVVLKNDGSVLEGWPKILSGISHIKPALADIDGDGFLDVIVGSSPGMAHHIYVFNNRGELLPGWPISGQGPITSEFAIGDIDNDGNMEIFYGTGSGKYGNMLNKNGQPVAGWDLDYLGETVFGVPAMVDFNGDGKLEILFNSRQGIHFYFPDRSKKLGWPINVTHRRMMDLPDRNAGVIVGDVNGDGYMDFITHLNERIYAFDTYGRPLPGFPRNSFLPSNSTPVIADVDGNGKTDLVVQVGPNLTIWEMGGNYNEELIPWPTVGQNVQRTGSYLPRTPLPQVAIRATKSGNGQGHLEFTPNIGIDCGEHAGGIVNNQCTATLNKGRRFIPYFRALEGSRFLRAEGLEGGTPNNLFECRPASEVPDVEPNRPGQVCYLTINRDTDINVVFERAALADLTVTDLRVTPESPALGQALNVSFKVKNIGQGNARAHVSKISLVDSNQESYGNLIVEIPSINAGAEHLVNTAFPHTANTVGAFSLLVIGDHGDGGIVDETNEDNNNAESTVNFVDSKSDLIVESLVVDQARARLNEQVPVRIVVRNIGELMTNVPVQMEVSLQKVGSSVVVTQNILVNILDREASREFTAYVKPTSVGQWKVDVRIDKANALLESDEGNNTASLISDIVKRRVDLSVKSLTGDVTVKKGDLLYFAIEIENKGPDAQIVPTSLKVTVSGAATFSKVYPIGASEPGDPSIPLMVTGVKALKVGTAVIRVEYDYLRKAPDTNRNNNVMSKEVTVMRRMSDLTVNFTTDKSSMKKGQSVNLSVEVKNIGTDVPNIATKLKVTVTGAGNVSRIYTIAADLSKDTVMVPIFLSVRATKIGNMTIKIEADYLKKASDVNRENNMQIKRIAVTN